MRAHLWVKCLARGGRFPRSLLETTKGPCVSSLSVLLVQNVTACPCIRWGPWSGWMWGSIKASGLGPWQAVAHLRELKSASLTFPGRREASGRPAQEQRDSLTSQMGTHTKPARYLGWADLTISPFKDYPLNCPSHTPPLAPPEPFVRMSSI